MQMLVTFIKKKKKNSHGMPSSERETILENSHFLGEASVGKNRYNSVLFKKHLKQNGRISKMTKHWVPISLCDKTLYSVLQFATE